MTRTLPVVRVALLCVFGRFSRLSAGEPAVDLSRYRADSGITVQPARTAASRFMADGTHETGQLDLDLRPGQPLIASMGFVGRDG